MIKIVTDSSSYLKRSEAQALDSRIVPIHYMVDHESYPESYADENHGYKELLRSGTALGTSQPSLQAFVDVFQQELAAGHEVICITISSRLSGTYSAAYMAAQQIGSDRIRVLDSRLTAGGLYLLIIEARRLIDAGEPLAAVAQQLEALRETITVSFSVDDLAPLLRSGRIVSVRTGVRTILNLRPILLCKDGAVVFDSIARGTEQTVQKLTAKIPAAASQVVVNYIDNTRTATNIYNVIKGRFPQMPVKLQLMGPVLGVHLGLEVIGVSYISPPPS